jgi:hypothetical protein
MKLMKTPGIPLLQSNLIDFLQNQLRLQNHLKSAILHLPQNEIDEFLAELEGW